MCLIAVSFRLDRITSNRLTRTTSSDLPARTTSDCRAGIALPLALFHGQDARATFHTPGHEQDAHGTGGRDAHGTQGQDALATGDAYDTVHGQDARATGLGLFSHWQDAHVTTGGRPLYVTAITASAGAPVKVESGVCWIAGGRFQRSRRPEAGSGLLFGPAAGPTWAGGRQSSIMYSVSSIGLRHVAYITQLAQVWLCFPKSYKARVWCVHGVLGVTVA